MKRQRRSASKATTLTDIKPVNSGEGSDNADFETALAALPERLPRDGVGRPTKFSRDRVTRIVRHLRDGSHPEVACKASGVGYSTFLAWMERGEADQDGPFRMMFDLVERAIAESEIEAIREIRTAGRNAKNWGANVAWLERRHPDRWRRRDDGGNGTPVVVLVGAALPGMPGGPILDAKVLRSANALPETNTNDR